MRRLKWRWFSLLIAGCVVVPSSGGDGSHAGAARAAASGQASGIRNVQVSRDGYTAHAEPSVAVDPRDPHILLGAAMFIQNHHVVAGTFSSADGGQSWDDRGPLAMPRGTTYSGDVTAAFNATGSGFVSSLTQAADGDGVYVWRSDDGGRHFRHPVAVMRGPFADHPGLAVDTTQGTGSSDLYVAWRTRAGLAFNRSVDGGLHFTAPRLIVPGTEVYVPVVAAGPRGAVYVAYEVITAGPTGPDGYVAVVTSADHGRTFRRPVVVGPMTDTLTPAPDVRLPSGPSIAVDARSGDAYVTFALQGANSAAILLSRSCDSGHTWSASAPIEMAPAAASGTPFQPRVVVDGSGSVDVTAFVLAHGRVALNLTRSITQGGSFGPSQSVTSRSFDPALGVISAGKGDQGSHWWIGDYQGLAASGGVIHPFWSDTRTGRLEIFTAAIPTAM